LLSLNELGLIKLRDLRTHFDLEYFTIMPSRISYARRLLFARNSELVDTFSTMLQSAEE
jgi:hypothetical protein